MHSRGQWARWDLNPHAPSGAAAFKAALADSGLDRDDVDGLAVNLGWPLGMDYDRIAEAFGLRTRYVSQTWTHGRFGTMSVQQAVMAVASGMADGTASVATCTTAIRSSARRPGPSAAS